MEWLKQQRACKDAECLTQTYQARIAQLRQVETATASAQPAQPAPTATKAVTKKVSFKITEGQGEPLCEEYLKVLNRTAWDDLQACKLPDLKGSPIQAVDFKPLSGDALKSMDKLVYERSTHKKDWETAWPTRQHEYEIGYKKLGEAYWDLDGDGVIDQVIEHQESWNSCEPYGSGESNVERKILETRWNNISVDEKHLSAEKYGYQKSYFSLQGGIMFYIDAGAFIDFGSEKFTVWGTLIRQKNTSTKWDDKNWVYLSRVDKKQDSKQMLFGLKPSVCTFWLN